MRQSTQPALLCQPPSQPCLEFPSRSALSLVWLRQYSLRASLPGVSPVRKFAPQVGEGVAPSLFSFIPRERELGLYLFFRISFHPLYYHSISFSSHDHSSFHPLYYHSISFSSHDHSYLVGFFSYFSWKYSIIKSPSVKTEGLRDV